MSDLSLCLWRKECPLAPRCYRTTAPPADVHQSYFAPTTRGEKCEHFIPNDDRKEDKR